MQNDGTYFVTGFLNFRKNVAFCYSYSAHSLHCAVCSALVFH